MVMSGSAPKWVIVKSSRNYTGGPQYKGPSWRYVFEAGEVHVPDSFDSRWIAEQYAAKLSEHNLVGFHVEKYKEPEKKSR